MNDHNDEVPFVKKGGGIPTVGGVPADRRFYLRESKKERDAFYGSRRWRRFRLAYLREHPLCGRCLAKGFYVPTYIPHHIIDRLERPDLAWDEDNLEPLCNACHTRHHKPYHKPHHRRRRK